MLNKEDRESLKSSTSQSHLRKENWYIFLGKIIYLEPDNVLKALSACSLWSSWKDRHYSHELKLWQELYLDGRVKKDISGSKNFRWTFRNEEVFTSQRLEEGQEVKGKKKKQNKQESLNKSSWHIQRTTGAWHVLKQRNAGQSSRRWGGTS